MEYIKTALHKCIRCGVHRKDRQRDYYGLWFVDLEKRTAWCPGCAGIAARRDYRDEANPTIVSIHLQAIWSLDN